MNPCGKKKKKKKKRSRVGALPSHPGPATIRQPRYSNLLGTTVRGAKKKSPSVVCVVVTEADITATCWVYGVSKALVDVEKKR
ncbi:hypothetical protein AGABI2DRAFT_138585 [Agaricus bisporus var. bisporus H97]|uniref:hypothetical protein n=1 Tax=Agaricus bisporus var. bisporus (strain H97 / ATCC MYA-4626 / FGSC 10389) TaxID=936046 RepID=UPI00029F71D6|nr:hypothetical protein AGABI2DRAFT_138585 [Agaricus bisporus var. bisporus H97]EKV44186.1 hypothetical protein AGABI2DRAFT_138585 [Agaricus bisporus var. bisporus H97]